MSDVHCGPNLTLALKLDEHGNAHPFKDSRGERHRAFSHSLKCNLRVGLLIE